MSGVRKRRLIFNRMTEKKKARNTCQTLALETKEKEEDLAAKESLQFLPRPADTSRPKPPRLRKTTSKVHQYSMGELLAVLYSAKKDTVPGRDQVSIIAPQTLPGNEMEQLLQWYDRIWDQGELLEEWKLSVVTPIAKPRKTPLDAKNLQPLSLTSNLCKTTEQMFLARLTCILETGGKLHRLQTGFCALLSTQDSWRCCKRTLPR